MHIPKCKYCCIAAYQMAGSLGLLFELLLLMLWWVFLVWVCFSFLVVFLFACCLFFNQILLEAYFPFLKILLPFEKQAPQYDTRTLTKILLTFSLHWFSLFCQFSFLIISCHHLISLNRDKQIDFPF